MKQNRANDIKYTQAMLRHLPKFFMQLYFRERAADPHDDQPEGGDLVRKTIKRQSTLGASRGSPVADDEENQGEGDE